MNHFQPRLGVAYDVHGDHDLVIFGGAGRYYDESLFIEGQIEQQMNSSITISQALPACFGCAHRRLTCHDPDALRQFFASQGFHGGAVWVLPNKLKTPYSDQFDLGVRKQFGEIQTSLTYSHIESHNLFLYARANFYDNGWCFRVADAGRLRERRRRWINDNVPNGPFPNCPVSGAQLPGFQGKVNRGLDNGRARLNALYLHIEKPFTDRSTWGFTESLTLQHAKTNVGQDPFNQDEMFNGTELDVFGWNYLPNVPKWNSVTSATYRAPWGITLSGILSLNSGPAFGHIFLSVILTRPRAHAARAISRASISRTRRSATSGSISAWPRPSRCLGATNSPSMRKHSTYSTGSTGPIRLGEQAPATRRRSRNMVRSAMTSASSRSAQATSSSLASDFGRGAATSPSFFFG